MSKNSGQSHTIYPSAPSADKDEFQRGAPPPSYEESLRMNSAPQPQQYYGFPCHQLQQQQQQQQQPNQFPTHSQPLINPGAPPPATLYGYTNPYQAHVLQQQIYYNTASAAPQQMTPAQNVLHFDKRAQIRTTATGAISVPPPPPGCAPTPGQLAAMTGQSVMVKKEKKRFFF